MTSIIASSSCYSTNSIQQTLLLLTSTRLFLESSVLPLSGCLSSTKSASSNCQQQNCSLLDFLLFSSSSSLKWFHDANFRSIQFITDLCFVTSPNNSSHHQEQKDAAINRSINLINDVLDHFLLHSRFFQFNLKILSIDVISSETLRLVRRIHYLEQLELSNSFLSSSNSVSLLSRQPDYFSSISFPRLKQLDLNNISGLHSIPQLPSSSLESLSLVGCKDLKDVKGLSSSNNVLVFPQLKSIIFESCPLLTDETSIALISTTNCPHLEHLHVRNCEGLNFSGLCNIHPESVHKNLKSLGLDIVAVEDEIAALRKDEDDAKFLKGAKEIARLFPFITDLLINGRFTRSFSDDLVDELQRQHKLFDFDSSSSSFSKNSLKLEHLIWVPGQQETPMSFKFLRRASNLKTLHIRFPNFTSLPTEQNNNNNNNTRQERIAESFVQNFPRDAFELKQVELWNVPFSGSEWSDAGGVVDVMNRTFDAVRTLTINFSPNLEDVSSFILRFRQLEELCINDCSNLNFLENSTNNSNKSFVAFPAAFFPCLRSVTFYQSPKTTPQHSCLVPLLILASHSAVIERLTLIERNEATMTRNSPHRVRQGLVQKNASSLAQALRDCSTALTRSLRFLNLSFSGDVTDEVLSELGELQNLETLVVDSCPEISLVGLKFLRHAKSLSVLSVRGNFQFYKEGVRKSEIEAERERSASRVRSARRSQSRERSTHTNTTPSSSLPPLSPTSNNNSVLETLSFRRSSPIRKSDPLPVVRYFPVEQVFPETARMTSSSSSSSRRSVQIVVDDGIAVGLD